MLRPDIKYVEGSDEVLEFAIEWVQRPADGSDLGLDTVQWFNQILAAFHQFCEDRQIRIEDLWERERIRRQYILTGRR